MLSLVAAVALAVAACTAGAPPMTVEEMRARESYVSAMWDKLRSYRLRMKVEAKEGTAAVQIVIARDGRVLDAHLVRSSGETEMDTGMLLALYRNGPYAPLPPEIPGSSATFHLQMGAIRAAP